MLPHSQHTVWLHHFSDAKLDLSSGAASLIPPWNNVSSTFPLMVPFALLNTAAPMPSFLPRLLVGS